MELTPTGEGKGLEDKSWVLVLSQQRLQSVSQSSGTEMAFQSYEFLCLGQDFIALHPHCWMLQGGVGGGFCEAVLPANCTPAAYRMIISLVKG